MLLAIGPIGHGIFYSKCIYNKAQKEYLDKSLYIQDIPSLGCLKL